MLKTGFLRSRQLYETFGKSVPTQMAIMPMPELAHPDSSPFCSRRDLGFKRYTLIYTAKRSVRLFGQQYSLIYKASEV